MAEEAERKDSIVPNLREIPPVQSGDVYEFMYDVETRAGHTHLKGSRLYVHDSTERSPHYEISQSGKNWICRTDHGISVWATLEQCLSRKLLKKVGGPS